MADEFKNIRDNLFKALLSSVQPQNDEEYSDETKTTYLDPKAARELLGTLIQRAGRGKDDVVQIVAKEIGQAVAAMLKEPLHKIASSQKLKVTFELVPKEEGSKVEVFEEDDEYEEENEEDYDDEEEDN